MKRPCKRRQHARYCEEDNAVAADGGGGGGGGGEGGGDDDDVGESTVLGQFDPKAQVASSRPCATET